MTPGLAPLDFKDFLVFTVILFCQTISVERIRQLNVRTGEHIEISPLTKKKVKPKGSVISDHLLHRNHSPSFENFSVITKENKKFLLRKSPNNER